MKVVPYIVASLCLLVSSATFADGISVVDQAVRAARCFQWPERDVRKVHQNFTELSLAQPFHLGVSVKKARMVWVLPSGKCQHEPDAAVSEDQMKLGYAVVSYPGTTEAYTRAVLLMVWARPDGANLFAGEQY